MPGVHGRVLALLTLLFFLRVLGQALVAFFGVAWLPSHGGMVLRSHPLPYSSDHPTRHVDPHDQDLSDVWRGTRLLRNVPTALVAISHGFSAIYAGSMVLRYVLTMIFHPEMRWLGGRFQLFFTLCWRLHLHLGKVPYSRKRYLQGLTSHAKNLLVWRTEWIFSNWRTKHYKAFYPSGRNCVKY